MSSSVNQRLHDTVLAVFAADSFSLGAHWEHDAANIEKAFGGRLTEQKAPIASYHAGRQAGDQTHIGTNALWLLDVLAEHSDKASTNFDAALAAYISKWRAAWDVPDDKLPGYKDSATKGTLAGLNDGKTGVEAASEDDDMSHALRWFPVIAVIKDEEGLVKAARAVTSSFQKAENQILTAEFFARVFYRVIHQNEDPVHAVNSAATKMNSPWVNERVAHGQKLSSDSDYLSVLRSLGEVKKIGERTVYTGLGCGTVRGLPAVVYHLHRWAAGSNQPSEVIIDTVNAGGNSNARAMALAAILYGAKGIENDTHIKSWISNLRAKNQIESDLKKILKD